MNRIRKDNTGVSPVIATILMVAITVVLAGVLVVYLQTLPTSGGSVETNLGLHADRTATGDWLITITGGSQPAASITFQVIDPGTGAPAPTTTVPANLYNWLLVFGVAPHNWLAGGTATGVFNDNNANNKIDAGDSILLYGITSGHANGKDLTALKVQFTKGDSIVGTIGSLPS